MRFLYILAFSICLTGLTAISAMADITSLEMVSPETNGYSLHGFAEINSEVVVAVGLASTVMRSEDGALTWTQIQAPTMTSPDYYDLTILANGTLVAVGQEPGIFLSTDGGFTWSSPSLPVETTLRDICLRPDGSVSAAGQDGIILVSDDHGLSWEDVGPGGGLVNHHLWRTNQECIITSETGIQRTTDHGLSWEVVKPGWSFGFDEIFQVTELHLVSWQNFQRSDSFDGGESWTVSEFISPPYAFRTVVLDSLHWILGEFGEGAELHETFDGGETWEYLNYHQAMGYTSLTTLSNGRILATCSDGQIHWSDDLFTTVNPAWESILVDVPNISFNQVVERADGTLFVHGSNLVHPITAFLLRSDDGGGSWEVIAGGPTIRLNELVFFGDDHALACDNQQIQYSNDGGLTWAQSTTDPGYTIVDLAIASDSAFFATVNMTVGGNLIVSADGGATWNVVAGGLPANSLKDAEVEFVSPMEGWVTGLVVGANVMFRTLDGGQTWQDISSSDLAGIPSCMLWLDADNGYLGIRNGSSTQGVYRTSNAGLNWDKLSSNRTTSIVAGAEGEYLALGPTPNDSRWSLDGGQTWGPIFNPFRVSFSTRLIGSNAALFTGDSWLMCGNVGAIFKLTVDAVSSVGEVELPGRGNRLLSVSPNPFNPSTTISLNIPADAGFLALEIFDIRGTRICGLWQGEHDSGLMEVRWDGRNNQGKYVPSGIYFARLDGGKFQAVGKMMLLK